MFNQQHAADCMLGNVSANTKQLALPCSADNCSAIQDIDTSSRNALHKYLFQTVTMLQQAPGPEKGSL